MVPWTEDGGKQQTMTTTHGSPDKSFSAAGRVSQLTGSTIPGPDNAELSEDFNSQNTPFSPTLQNQTTSTSGVVPSDKDLRQQLDIPPSAEILYTDGACPSNGKTSSTAGIGIFYGPHDPRNVSLRLPGLYQTNQRAELYAVVHALEAYPVPNVSAPDADVSAPRHVVVIITDSKYVIKGITEWSTTWERNAYLNTKNTPVISRDLFIRARKRIRDLESRGVRVEFRHVWGHSGVWGNEMADRLAVMGAGSMHVVDQSMEREFEDEELDRAIAEGMVGELGG